MNELDLKKADLLNTIDHSKEEVVVVDIEGVPTAQIRKLEKAEIDARKIITLPEVVEVVEPEPTTDQLLSAEINRLTELVAKDGADVNDYAKIDAIWKLKQLNA